MDKRFLDILVCPICKGKLIMKRQTQELMCRADRLAFQIHDNIPVMLVDKARQLDEPEIEALTS